MEAIASFLLLAGAALACPLGMWLMMRFCRRDKGDMACGTDGQKHAQKSEQVTTSQEQAMKQTQVAPLEEVAALQAKVEALERELSRLRSWEATARAQHDGKAEELPETPQ